MLTTLKKPQGFTIIELLIVIVIIAILAAITLVAYSGFQTRAHQVTAQADAAQLAKLLAASNVTSGSFPGDLSTINNGGPLPSNDGTTYAYHPGSGNSSYCVTVTNADASYAISDTNTTPRAGGCPGDGVNGQAAITNLSVNPLALASGPGWQNNDGSKFTVTKGVSVSGNPSGITTAVSSQLISGQTNSCVLSIYNPDTLGNSSTIRNFGVWVEVNAPSYYAQISGSGSTVSLSSNSWSWITASNVSGYIGIQICKSGVPASTDIGYATGGMVVSGGSVSSYKDGNSPNWIWNGATNASSSTGPA